MVAGDPVIIKLDTMSTGAQPLTGPSGPSQQLGAVPGTAMNAVPGFDGNELGSDFAEFASSGEAEVAPRDYDEELPDELLEEARRANFVTTREPENLDHESGSFYETDSPERDLRGDDARVTANLGSRPAAMSLVMREPLARREEAIFAQG